MVTTAPWYYISTVRSRIRRFFSHRSSPPNWWQLFDTAPNINTTPTVQPAVRTTEVETYVSLLSAPILPPALSICRWSAYRPMPSPTLLFYSVQHFLYHVDGQHTVPFSLDSPLLQCPALSVCRWSAYRPLSHWTPLLQSPALSVDGQHTVPSPAGHSPSAVSSIFNV